MRKFIISDIHGFGNVYYSIMAYLDNISQNDEIELYINGDLIDRGLESAEILLDIKKRIMDNKYKIIFLGGNHELLMYEELERQRRGIFSYYNDWYLNGGYITDDGLDEFLSDKEKIQELEDFISNLKLYHKFEETINDKNIVLVHAACPKIVLDECDLKIKDANIGHIVWARESNPIIDPHIGNKDYFTIVGHTPNNHKYGYVYHRNGNYLNIDGGCAYYVTGGFKYDHFPLVEVCDEYLKILTFNSNNEIIYGNYFTKNRSIAYTPNKLNEERNKLDPNVKIKKLSTNEDGVTSYWN